MIIDPYGDVIAECRSFDDDIAIAMCTSDKLEKAGGFRYKNARRPELYKEILGQSHIPLQKVSWIGTEKPAA